MIAVLALLLLRETVVAQVYYGKLDGAQKPAEVVAKTVFAEIPEYRKIKEKGLTQDDPEYWILLGKANDKFYAAVRKVGELNKFDVIVEKGTAKFDTTPPDVTQKVIAALLP
ncbi:MAG: hypothetical protein HYY17_04900 [Planctomycetes bacterium]|nr:hypothetical protein [Planctomycetota bacterium]